MDRLSLPLLLTHLFALVERDAREDERRRCAAAMCQGCREEWPLWEDCHSTPGGGSQFCTSKAIRELKGA